MDDVKTTVDRLRRQLFRRNAAQLVCDDRTGLCVEGYPRSANTYLADFLISLFHKHDFWFHLAHHTHQVENLRIARLLGVPGLILVRRPADAITSLLIYSGDEVGQLVERYLKFYTGVLALEADFPIVDFDLVVNDINAVFALLNQRYRLAIPLSDDPEGDRRKIQQLDLERVTERYQGDQEKITRTVAVPRRGRDRLKAEVYPRVLACLEQRPEVEAVYRKIQASPWYRTVVSPPDCR